MKKEGFEGEVWRRRVLKKRFGEGGFQRRGLEKEGFKEEVFKLHNEISPLKAALKRSDTDKYPTGSNSKRMLEQDA